MELAQLVLQRIGTNGSYNDAKVTINGWNSVKKRPTGKRGDKLPYSDMRVYTKSSTLLYLKECMIADYFHDPEVVAHLESLIPLEIIARG